MENAGSEAQTSILEEVRLDYHKIGMNQNPFESIPIFSELEPVELNDWLRYYVDSLSQLLCRCPEDRSCCVYIVGRSGSGKSTILNTLSRTLYKKGGIFPIYVRFPLCGGKTAFYGELLKQLPVWLLSLILDYAKRNPSKLPKNYIGSKLFNASFARDLYRFVEKMRISPQYTTESIVSLFSLIITVIEGKRIALILDEFEHAWTRFTGAQKFNWEKSMAELLLCLKSKVVLVFPVWPEKAALGQRPYLNMCEWNEIDLDPILKITESNFVEIKCSQVQLKECLHAITNRCIIDEYGSQFCSSLIDKLKEYPTIGEAILDLHDQVVRIGSGRQRPWE